MGCGGRCVVLSGALCEVRHHDKGCIRIHRNCRLRHVTRLTTRPSCATANRHHISLKLAQCCRSASSAAPSPAHHRRTRMAAPAARRPAAPSTASTGSPGSALMAAGASPTASAGLARARAPHPAASHSTARAAGSGQHAPPCAVSGPRHDFSFPPVPSLLFSSLLQPPLSTHRQLKLYVLRVQDVPRPLAVKVEHRQQRQAQHADGQRKRGCRGGKLYPRSGREVDKQRRNAQRKCEERAPPALLAALRPVRRKGRLGRRRPVAGAVV